MITCVHTLYHTKFQLEYITGKVLRSFNKLILTNSFSIHHWRPGIDKGSFICKYDTSIIAKVVAKRIKSHFIEPSISNEVVYCLYAIKCFFPPMNMQWQTFLNLNVLSQLRMVHGISLKEHFPFCNPSLTVVNMC